jgi:hypothetical protein
MRRRRRGSWKALARAERLRAVMAELAPLAASRAAAVLTERGIPGPMGGSRWYTTQVIRIRRRLALLAGSPTVSERQGS